MALGVERLLRPARTDVVATVAAAVVLARGERHDREQHRGGDAPPTASREGCFAPEQGVCHAGASGNRRARSPVACARHFGGGAVLPSGRRRTALSFSPEAPGATPG